MATETTAAPADTQAAAETAAAALAAAEAEKTPKAGEAAIAAPAGAPATPQVPDKYTLTLPEDSPFMDSDLVGFAEEAKALGLSQDAAQQLVNTRTAQVTRAASTYLAELQADPELGGAKFEATKAMAVAGRDVLFPPGSEEAALINDWFDRTGLGNHKLLVRAFARLGQRMTEDSGVPQGSKAGEAEKLTPAQVMYGKDGTGRRSETQSG